MRKYFGRYPLFNWLASSFFFWALERRKRRLRKKNVKKFRNANQFVLENTEKTTQEFQKYLDKDYNKVSIGGGYKKLEGYLNVDFVDHPDIEDEVVANILDLSFMPDKCVTHMHSNHVVEHITQEQFEDLLKSAKRILKPGGVFTLRCPNVLGVSYGFFHGAVQEWKRDEFIEAGFPADEEFANPKDNWYEKDLYAYVHWVWGDVGNPENQHLNYFTPTLMQETLEKNGFRIVIMNQPEASNLAVVATPV